MRAAIIIFSLFSLAAQAAETTTRTCRILFLSAPDDAPETLFLFDGANAQEVELTRMGFSPTYKISAGASALALLPAAPPDPGKAGTAPVVPAGAPTATLGASVRDFYLLVSSDAANKVAPVRMQVINANQEDFKRGQMLWYNLTQTKVGGIVGSRKLVIAPNSRLILDAPAPGKEDYHVDLHFLPPGKEETEPLCETNWSHDPRSRGVFFILMPEGRLIPRIVGFSDFREVSK